MGSLWSLKKHLRRGLQIILHKPHLKRTGTIALLIGTWLTLFNQGDILLAGTCSPALALKIFLNYLTPFGVSNMGLLSRNPC